MTGLDCEKRRGKRQSERLDMCMEGKSGWSVKSGTCRAKVCGYTHHHKYYSAVATTLRNLQGRGISDEKKESIY